MLALIVATVTLAVAVPASSASPSPTSQPIPQRFVSQNRDWWTHLTREEKLKVVEGEVDGLVNGWWRAFMDYDTKIELTVTNSKFKNSADRTLLDGEVAKAQRSEKASPPNFSKKFGVYIDAIDAFYQTYPDAGNVLVGNVMQCLSDKPWKSCVEVAKIFGTKPNP